MIIRTRTFAATAAALVVASLLATTASYAQDAPAEEVGPQTWAVQPADASGPDGRGQLDYVIEPGDIYEDRIAVRNFGEGPLTVTLEVFDAAQTPENGFELGEAGDEQRGVGAWFELPEGQITVEPRSFTVVPFTFDVPVDAEPCDLAGGIVAVSLIDPEQTGAVMQYRVGTRVHVRVAGPVEPSLGIEGVQGAYSGSLVPFSSGEVGIEAMLTNGGNVRLSPAVTLTARGLFGLWQRSATVEGLDELLPQGAASLAESIGGVPQIGPVWVTLEATGVESRGQDLAGTMDLPEQTVVVWAVPWVLLGIVFLLVLALVLLVVRSFRRKIES